MGCSVRSLDCRRNVALSVLPPASSACPVPSSVSKHQWQAPFDSVFLTCHSACHEAEHHDSAQCWPMPVQV